VTLGIKWCWIVMLTLDPSLTQYGGWRFIPGSHCAEDREMVELGIESRTKRATLDRR